MNNARLKLRGLIAARHVAICILILMVAWPPAASAGVEDAQALQDQAVARIDRFVDHFRRTFDPDSLFNELLQAEAELIRSVEIFEQFGAPAGAAFSIVKLGDLYRYTDNWDEAISRYEQAADIASRADAPAVECKALVGHARALMYGKSTPGPALPLVERAIPLAKRVDDRSYLFDAWDLLAQVQVSLGDLVGAADSMNRAFSMEDAVADDTLRYYGYLDRAEIYQKFAEKCDYQRNFESCLDAVDRSRRDYEQALQVARKLRWDGLAEQTEGFIQRLAIREEMISQQQRMHEMLGDSDLFSPSDADDVHISNNFTAGENPQLAGLFAWLEYAGGLPPATDARGAYIRGLLHESEGDYDEALAAYLRSTELLDQDRRSLYDERARGAYVEDRVEFYYTTILQLLAHGRTAEAFEMLERSRSRVMSDLIASRDIALTAPKERSLYAEMLGLRSQIARYQTCLFALRGDDQGGGGCTALAGEGLGAGDDTRGVGAVGATAAPLLPDAVAVQAALEQRQRRFGAVQAELIETSPRMARLVSSEPVSLKSLQRTLAADGSELITYLAFESQLIVWHIAPKSIEVKSVFLPRSALKKRVEGLRRSLIDPEKPFDEQTAHELFLFLISPLLDDIKSEHLVIVPHEDLHYLPFQALLTERGGRFLGEQFRISYAPSATVLVSLEPTAPVSGARLLAAADPSLGHAPAEVRAIGELFDGHVIDETLPTEAELRSLMPGKGLVHLAVHGTFEAEEPLLSYLHLSPGGDDDGRMTAAEMYGLPLDAANLVVLSACETGTVRASHANEVVGMMRGLIFAGADSLLLSSWKIDDEATAIWMRTFYDNVAATPPAEAARLAISELRNDPRFEHPYYWSPFLLTSR